MSRRKADPGTARLLLFFLATLGILLVALLLATATLATPWVVVGRSMEPSLSHGDRVIVDLWTYRHRPPRPGEIILFDGPGPHAAPLIKRCALPPTGPAATPLWEHWPETVGRPPGIWVLGDNPAPGESLDSRRFGAVPLDRLRGRVLGRYWPSAGSGSIR